MNSFIKEVKHRVSGCRHLKYHQPKLGDTLGMTHRPKTHDAPSVVYTVGVRNWIAFSQHVYIEAPTPMRWYLKMEPLGLGEDNHWSPHAGLVPLSLETPQSWLALFLSQVRTQQRGDYLQPKERATITNWPRWHSNFQSSEVWEHTTPLFKPLSLRHFVTEVRARLRQQAI